MNQLYPIIRRIRCPLLPVETPKEQKVEVVFQPDKTSTEPVTEAKPENASNEAGEY
jgi:hypothetical protein